MCVSSCEGSTPICLHARLTLVPHSHAALATMHSHPHWVEGQVPLGAGTQEGTLPAAPAHSYLAWCALSPVQWGPLLGLAEVWVVGVAAPQLLAGLEGPELRGKGDRVTGLDWPSSSGKLSRGTNGDREGAGCGWALRPHCQGGRRGPSNQSPARPPAQLHPKCQWPPATPQRRRHQPQPTRLCSPLQDLPPCLEEASLSPSRDQGLRLWGG